MNRKVKGLDINYIDRGQGELVVILHGWGSNITLHEHMIGVLESKYRVIAMDMPGFGESQEPPESWCVDDYADFVLEFLEEYAPKSLTLMGHSFGGRVIIKLCSRELPFEIDKIVLMDSAGVMPKKSLRQKTKQKLYKATRSIYSSAPVQKMFPEALENLRRKNGSADYNAASPVMRQTLVRVVNEDLCELMPNVKAPTLLVWGTLDDATPLSDALLMEKLMPEAGLVKFEGAGHYAFLECRDQFARVLASFMNISL